MPSKRLLDKVERLLKEERGTVFKDPGGRVNICLIYPNLYHVGMSNLAVQGLYSMINAREDALAERAFLPDVEDIEEMKRTSTELFALESRRPLRDFHVLGFSVSFENDYPNIPLILKLAGIPVLSMHRDDRYPLVLGGGVAISSNPEPLADLFDVIFIGEAEEAIDEIIEVIKNNSDRKRTLKELARIEGVYVPCAYRVHYLPDGTIQKRERLWEEVPKRVKKRTIHEFHPLFRHAITTAQTEFSDMTLVEAMRGCPWRCGFCLSGHIYWPVRHKSLERLKEEVKGNKRVGLVGPSLTEYRFIEDALREGFVTTITSVRVTERTRGLLNLLQSQQSISIAPESSERMRWAMGKRFSDEEIVELASEVLSSGFRSLRCYFMVGLPGETDEDIEGIINLVRAIRESSKKGKTVVSISVFVPKPHTPLQWSPMAEEGVVKERLKRLKKTLQPLKAIEVFHEVPKYAYLQGLLSRGDRRLSVWLSELKNPSQWMKELSERGLDVRDYLYRARHREETLPWDFIDAGFSKEELWQRYLQIIDSLKGPAGRHI